MFLSKFCNGKGACPGFEMRSSRLAQVYRFKTSGGALLFREIQERSAADALHEQDAEFVIWYNADRRQERYLDDVFASNRLNFLR